MKQDDSVIEAMKQNGGYATLRQLYELVDFSSWRTKTPDATIRRIVQENPAFFQIRAGLWALKDFRDKLPSEILPHIDASKDEIETTNHTYYQGLLVEIGNIEKYRTYVPKSDKNKIFFKKSLGEITQLSKCLEFTSYPNVIKRAANIDVIWFNERGFPHAVYEVENTTNMQNSLGKFVELQDFYVEFWIVADEKRKEEYNRKIGYAEFRPIAERVEFLDYKELSEWYDKTYALHLVRPKR